MKIIEGLWMHLCCLFICNLIHKYNNDNIDIILDIYEDNIKIDRCVMDSMISDSLYSHSCCICMESGGISVPCGHTSVPSCDRYYHPICAYLVTVYNIYRQVPR